MFSFPKMKKHFKNVYFAVQTRRSEPQRRSFVALSLSTVMYGLLRSYCFHYTRAVYKRVAWNILTWICGRTSHPMTVVQRFSRICQIVNSLDVQWTVTQLVGKVAGSIPNGVTGIFHWHNASVRTMALGLIQPLTEMRTRNISCEVKGGWCVGLTTLPPSCADCLEIWGQPQPQGLYRDCFRFTGWTTDYFVFISANNVRTCYGPDPFSCSTWTRTVYMQGLKWSGREPDHSSSLVPTWRMGSAVPLLPLYAFISLI
jgi:hypothetical protein